MAPRRPRAAAVAGHLRRSERWAGLRVGDPVRIEGSRLRSASWTFLAQVENVRTGEQWVEVVGGRSGERQLRSFRPDQVHPAGSGRGARAYPSLDRAPQLPLD